MKTEAREVVAVCASSKPKKLASKGIKTPPRPPYHLLADPDWAEEGATNLLISAYRILNMPGWRGTRDGVPGIQANRARAMFTTKRLTYLDTSEGMYAAPEGDGLVVNPDFFRWPDLEEAPYLLVLSAFDEAGAFQSRSDAERDIRALTGILVAAAGRNVAGDHVFELEVDLRSGNYIGSAGPVAVAFEAEPLKLDAELLDLLVSAAEAFASLPEEQQNLVSLSSRWFVKGTAAEGHDAFIPFWVALETLSMPDGTNVRPAVQKLAELYGIDQDEARTMFELGRLQGLRSEILHQGRAPLLDEGINLFLAAIYRDLAKERLGLPFGAHAQVALEQSQLDVSEYLSTLSRNND